MKYFFMLALAAFTMFASSSLYAANKCSILYTNAIETSPTSSLASAKKAVDRLKSVVLSNKEQRLIRALVRDLRIDAIENTNDLASALREKLSARAADQLLKANDYSELSQKIMKVIEKRMTDFLDSKDISLEANKIYSLNKDQLTEIVKNQDPNLSAARVKTKVDKLLAEYNDIKLQILRAKYTFAEKISKMEEFDISEYQQADSTPLTRPGYTVISLSEYPAFAMALAKNEAPPRPYGNGGVVSLPEYRNMVSNNMWLFTLQGHDLKHIHFANSHPMAASILFRNTRSKNHLRYVLIAGLFEGVDTIQYSWESSLARHYSSQGYSLEQGMLDIAMLNQTQLNELARKVGINADQFAGWKPLKVIPSALPENAPTPENYEKDIIRFMAKSLTDLMNPRVNIYMRPDMIPDDITVPAGTSMKPGEIIHHY